MMNASKTIKWLPALSLCILIFMSFLGEDAYAAGSRDAALGFARQGNHVVYILWDGSLLRNSWLSIGNGRWYFDRKGHALLGEAFIDGKKWVLSLDGQAVMAAGQEPAAAEGTVQEQEFFEPAPPAEAVEERLILKPAGPEYIPDTEFGRMVRTALLAM